MRLRRGLFALGGPGAPRHFTYSVVIAARNEEETIGTCLESVLRQSIGVAQYEVIVVDDRSTDRTAELI
ncbi:MAG: glycosyltransferase, partial [Chitinivibrionales bacterium]|nr:glycosyltransferase [Chitinivibrionales bacterium]